MSYSTASSTRTRVRARARTLVAITAALSAAGAGLALPASAYTPQGSASSYSFLTTLSPVPHWNPCAPVRFLVNDAAKPGAADDAREAAWRLGQAAGLAFEYQGTTSFVPTSSQPAPAGTDLVVAFVTHEQTDAWRGNTSAGYGSARITTSYKADGATGNRIINGYALIDSVPNFPAGFYGGSGTRRGELLMHEIGHASGLGHVSDSTQIMNPVVTPHNGQWGAGDLNGLSQLGANRGCAYTNASEASANQGSVLAQPADPFPGSHFNNDPTPNGTTPPPSSTPPPTDPTPTPSPSQAGSSPSPTPTSTPSGSQTSAPGVAPDDVSVSVSPSVVVAGQRVVATYSGPPGTVVDVMSRTQPATAFSRITTITLDESGRATTSHAPQKTTRLVARVGGRESSAQPLILVQSVASLRLERTGPQTYAFTGRVYPALANRLVNVYRGGVLLAQARCDAAGVYRVTSRLARGTYTFETRTPNDTHNVGARIARNATIS